MNIDAHQHFWIYNNTEYSWINDSMKVLQREFLPDDLHRELSAAGFSGSVAVQARQNAEETRWLLDLADRNPFIRGVVGWADIRSQSNLKKQLDEFCKSGRLAGLRHVVHDEPDDNFMLRDEFLEGISVLPDYGLTYDLLLFPRHLPVAEKMVAMFPDQKFVLDHIAKPLIKDKILDPWADDIKRLAAHKNVWCKLSGMVTETEWQSWKSSDFHPYLDIVFNAFGPGRLMTGSDWPVCTVAGRYSDVTAIVSKYISGMSPDDQKRILGMTCATFYNLR
jgi:L-fuconolactonase